jgi:hypothetical protein
MAYFRISFTGRKLGAIGINSRFTETVEAADPDAAVLKLYDKYEDVHVPTVKEVFPRLVPFPNGARIYIDGKQEAIVKQAFLEGSSSFMFPHYKVDIVDGDKNVAIHAQRCSVDKVRT